MKKKKFLVVLIVAVVVFIIAKIYFLTILDDLYNAIDNFRNEDNRYYSVSQKVSEITYKEEIWVKQSIIKYIEKSQNDVLHYEWENLETNEQYAFNDKNELLHNRDLSIEDEEFIKNLPNFISSLGEDGKFNIASVLKVRYIIPTKYENKECYKVVTKAETIMIDKNTYLPLYSAMKIHDSQGKEISRIEKTYKFEVGTVTAEDVLLPDLSN